MLFWLELQGTLQYAKNKEQNKRNNLHWKPGSKKAAARAIYNASPEMKRTAYHANYRADPKEQWAASRVASRASCLPPRVPLFKAYLCSCCKLWSGRISWFMTETDSTYFTTRPNPTTTAHTMPQKWQKLVT